MKTSTSELNKQVGEAATQKASKNQVVTYLKHLAMLSVALGCAIAVDAAPLSATASRTSEAAGISLAATAPHSSLDRLLAEAESRNALHGEFAINLPWYYRAWPESTWRQLGTQLNRAVAPQLPIDSFAGLMEEVNNEG